MFIQVMFFLFSEKYSVPGIPGTTGKKSQFGRRIGGRLTFLNGGY